MTDDYIAGFFDGEGSIIKIGTKGNRYMVSISQTHGGVLKQINKHIDSKGLLYHSKKRREYWKRAWVLHIKKQKDVLDFLESIVEKLVVKKQLAQMAIETIKLFLAAQQEEESKRLDIVRKALVLVNQGHSYRAIERKMMVDHSTVGSWVKKYKLINGNLTKK